MAVFTISRRSAVRAFLICLLLAQASCFGGNQAQNQPSKQQICRRAPNPIPIDERLEITLQPGQTQDFNLRERFARGQWNVPLKSFSIEEANRASGSSTLVAATLFDPNLHLETAKQIPGSELQALPPNGVVGAQRTFNVKVKDDCKHTGNMLLVVNVVPGSSTGLLAGATPTSRRVPFFIPRSDNFDPTVPEDTSAHVR